MTKTALVIVSIFALALGACGKNDGPTRTTTPSTPPAATSAGVAVGSVSVGNAVGPDKKIQGYSASMAPGDTIYVSIETTGKGDATLKSRWTYVKDGKSMLVKEDARKVSTTGPATHEFHISKPDGWPQGDYQIEVFVNDTAAVIRRFNVA